MGSAKPQYSHLMYNKHMQNNCDVLNFLTYTYQNLFVGHSMMAHIALPWLLNDPVFNNGMYSPILANPI